MKKFIWICAGVGFFIWSLLCWAAFGLIDVASNLATGTSDVFTPLVPGTESLVRGLINLADDVGELLLFVLWGGVGGVIFAGAWILDRILVPQAPRLFSAPPPPYAPMDADAHSAPYRAPSPQTGAQVLDRLRQRGVRNLKRDPGKDHWRAS
jgi:hypothetical protein